VLVLDEATSSVDALTEVRCRVRSSVSPPGAPPSPSLTVCPPPRVPIACWCSNTGAWCKTAPHTELVQVEGPYLRMYEAWVAATSAG
jgi:hypothetical protein